jgi:hypothetical protein
VRVWKTTQCGDGVREDLTVASPATEHTAGRAVGSGQRVHGRGREEQLIATASVKTHNSEMKFRCSHVANRKPYHQQKPTFLEPSGDGCVSRVARTQSECR